MKEFIAILTNELYKTIKRPRTYIGFGVIIFICAMLQAAFYHDGKEILSFVTQQLDNVFNVQGNILNGNLICFILLQTLIVQMPLLVALVTGDSVSGETASGTIRFLLTTPGSRTKIIVAKWLAGLFYTLILLLLLGFMALIVSKWIFGTGDLMALNSESLTIIRGDDINWRWGWAFLIAFLSLGVVASLAQMLSCFIDNSITPIVSVMAIIIVFTIIGMFDLPSFDVLKPFLFTTHMISWKSLFEDPIPLSDIYFSSIVLLIHIVLFLGVSIFYFKRKDILT
ncbi:MAG: ABC transporter permease subunit [Bacteroidetes bacterium]|jgi:ABC-2 type transport system permease protein|nr:ABC transporter permease subunit [Bacteroidota bacterium]MBK7039485.1 ABC transporter permease subunit [Bacteroidota bacterium]MBK9301497.1 ABC transporter permease subunit [Bacteroidota bacterium]